MRSHIIRSSIWLALQTASARLALVLVVFCMFAGSAEATNYISWNADGITGANRPWCPTENRACWTSEIIYPNTTFDTSIKHSGTASMKMTINGIGGNEPAGLHIPDMYGSPPNYPFNIVGSEMYYRWWMRIDPNFSWGNNPEGHRMKTSRTTAPTLGASWYTGYLGKTYFGISECDETPGHAGGCLGNAGQSYDGSYIAVNYDMASKADGQWHEYIVRVKANTSTTCTIMVNCDAELEAYVDGVSVGSYRNFKLTHINAPFFDAWGGWMVNPYFQMGSTVSAGGSIWVDDFSTDDVWNSSFSGGGDTTPPAAPTGLVVQ